MSQVVGLPNNSYKPITNTAWVRTQLCKLKTRGSQEPVISHLVFNLTSKVEIENRGVTHNFESGPPKDHFDSNF